jgi:putative endonuclease
MSSKITGTLGEDFAAELYEKLGYAVIKRNYHSRYGEIDLIAENDEFIVFVEVKTRKGNSMTSPKESVDFYKQKKIIKTAEYYLMKTGSEKQPRFDVFEVFQQNGRIYKFSHIESAFDAW